MWKLSRKGGTRGVGWDQPQGDLHMVAARLGFEKAMVGTRWATSRPDCMDRLRKHYSHLVEGLFLASKAAWALSGCMATDSADYCMLVNEWAGSITEKSRSLGKKVWPLQTSNSSSHDSCILEKAVYNHLTILA